MELASARVSSRLRPDAASAAVIASRSSSASSPKCSRPSTNSRSPWSVGSRPAEVWGANSRPASVRSAITLRMVAGERFIGSRRDSVRLPTGSPVSTYCSTISRSTAAERSSRPGGRATRNGMPAGLRGLSMSSSQTRVRRLRLEEGGMVVTHVECDDPQNRPVRTVLAELQGKVSRLLASAGVKPGTLPSEELIADRRAEAEREEHVYLEWRLARSAPRIWPRRSAP